MFWKPVSTFRTLPFWFSPCNRKGKHLDTPETQPHRQTFLLFQASLILGHKCPSKISLLAEMFYSYNDRSPPKCLYLRDSYMKFKCHKLLTTPLIYFYFYFLLNHQKLAEFLENKLWFRNVHREVILRIPGLPCALPTKSSHLLKPVRENSNAMLFFI
jgi:hypothetical protein